MLPLCCILTVVHPMLKKPPPLDPTSNIPLSQCPSSTMLRWTGAMLAVLQDFARVAQSQSDQEGGPQESWEEEATRDILWHPCEFVAASEVLQHTVWNHHSTILDNCQPVSNLYCFGQHSWACVGNSTAEVFAYKRLLWLVLVVHSWFGTETVFGHSNERMNEWSIDRSIPGTGQGEWLLISAGPLCSIWYYWSCSGLPAKIHLRRTALQWLEPL